jgi:FixJ family two-component response regulator
MDEHSRVSIVDDDPSVRRALERLCRSVGYGVHAFESAEAYLDAGESDQTDCLILDVHLPGRSGLELQSELVATHRQFPIIFITAFDDDRTRSQALSAGAREFLPKPLGSERLLDVIQQALEQLRE